MLFHVAEVCHWWWYWFIPCPDCTENAGIIVDNPATLLGLGDIKQPTVLFALFGFLMIVVLHQFKVRGAIISILVITGLRQPWA